MFGVTTLMLERHWAKATDRAAGRDSNNPLCLLLRIAGHGKPHRYLYGEPDRFAASFVQYDFPVG